MFGPYFNISTRIKSELALLGYDVAESTVAKYIVRHSKPPSQTWRTFLKNHASDIVACDYFTIHTVTFRVFYIFIMLRHSDRQIVHFNVTQNPTTAWTLQQVREAFPFDSAPRFLLHDNGSTFSRQFRHTLKTIGIESVKTAYRSPWQSPYVERVNGTLRRECLDHLIILNEKHLRRVLSVYVETYYNRVRSHLSINRNAPIPRKSDPPSNGKIISIPILGGLHHRYRRVAFTCRTWELNPPFETGQVHITRKSAKNWVQAWTPKDHEMRAVPLSDQAVNLLAAWQSAAPEECPYVFMEHGRWEYYRQEVSQGRWETGRDLVNNVLRRYKTICRKAGIGPYTIHDLRRSCITNWARDLPIHVVQQLAGHSDIKTTQQFYLSVREDDVAKAQKIQTALLGKIPIGAPTDQLLTHSGQTRVFPGMQECQPKKKALD